MSTTPRSSPLARHTAKRYPLSHIDEGLTVLQLISATRFATGIQIERAVFARRSLSARQARFRATRSLRRLFDAGYLRRVTVLAPSAASGRLSRQIVHCLSAQGARAVGMEPRLAQTRAPKPMQVLVHDFWLVEVPILAISQHPPELTIHTWYDDRFLMAQHRKGNMSLPIVPDGLLVIENPSTGRLYPCLVEVDLGSESIESHRGRRGDFARKIEGYLEYSERDFRQEFAIDGSPVVLIISDSQRRLESLRDATRKLGGKGRFWFATLDQLGANDRQVSRSAGLRWPFWASSWQTAHEDGWRSLSERCGVLRAEFNNRHL